MKITFLGSVFGRVRFWKPHKQGILVPQKLFLGKRFDGHFGKNLGKILFGKLEICFWETFGRTERTVEDDKKEFQGSLP